MTKTISVGDYDIYIGRKLLAQLPSIVIEFSSAACYVILSDSNVSPLYGEKLLADFTSMGIIF